MWELNRIPVLKFRLKIRNDFITSEAQRRKEKFYSIGSCYLIPIAYCLVPIAFFIDLILHPTKDTFHFLLNFLRFRAGIFGEINAI